LLVQRKTLIVKDGLPLVFSDIDEHVGVCHIFFLSFY